MLYCTGRLTWLVYIIGAVIGGRVSFASTDEHDEMDGELVCRSVYGWLRSIDYTHFHFSGHFPVQHGLPPWFSVYSHPCRYRVLARSMRMLRIRMTGDWETRGQLALGCMGFWSSIFSILMPFLVTQPTASMQWMDNLKIMFYSTVALCCHSHSVPLSICHMLVLGLNQTGYDQEVFTIG